MLAGPFFDTDVCQSVESGARCMRDATVEPRRPMRARGGRGGVAPPVAPPSSTGTGCAATSSMSQSDSPLRAPSLRVLPVLVSRAVLARSPWPPSAESRASPAAWAAARRKSGWESREMITSLPEGAICLL